MTVEATITAFLGGIITLAILSVVLAPQSTTASVITATTNGLGNLTTKAKAYP